MSDNRLVSSEVYDLVGKMPLSKRPFINENIISTVCSTKRLQHLTVRQKALIVLSRCETAQRLLGHDTGAQ
jgi:hypothetical protein